MVELKNIYGNGSARLKGDNFFIDYKDFPVDVTRRQRKPLKPIPRDEWRQRMYSPGAVAHDRNVHVTPHSGIPTDFVFQWSSLMS